MLFLNSIKSMASLFTGHSDQDLQNQQRILTLKRVPAANHSTLDLINLTGRAMTAPVIRFREGEEADHG